MKTPVFLLFSLSTAAGAFAQTAEAPKYLLPPKEVVAAFEAAPLPQAQLSPDRKVLALTYRTPYPTIAELSQPMLRLAGERVNPRNNGPHRVEKIHTIAIKSVADGKERKVALAPGSTVMYVRFSPSGHTLSFVNRKADRLELWVADVTTGVARLASGLDRLNAATGDPCSWLKDGVTLLCQTVPAGRGPEPKAPAVPTGPYVQETSGKPAPAPTFEDMIESAHDELLFEHYFKSQLVTYNTKTGVRALVGRPAIFDEASPSPGGDYILVARVKRPYSHLIPMGGFPRDVEVWTRKGEVALKVADVPTSEGVPLTGVITGPRGARRRADEPATLMWAEALDGGDARTKAPFRDKVMAASAPFKDAAREIAKTEYRFAGLQYTEKGVGLLSESDRVSRRVRTWILESGAAPRKLWDRRQDAAYENPGVPVTRSAGSGGGGFGGFGGGSSPIVQSGDSILLTGQGASPEGDRPFIDRLNLRTGATERLFRADAKTYETVVAPLDDDAKTILTRAETQTDTPNYYVRDLAASGKRALTAFADPQPQLRGVTRQFVTYERKDGVKLSGTLYLPPGYKQGERLPVILWAYPREFGDAASASQITGSPNRFTTVSGYSHLFLLLSGYAIFDDPTMPIIGSGETANDTYVEQLVASAQAAIDKVVEMGVGDRDRIGVGGHSYGAFMTANLMAHSRLFRAGFAESGAYNRSLTPFGFQSERRTFWEVPELYAKMSPFWNADKIKDPILLMHGEADDNSGTFPIQSERFYMALKGHGATVRYITLPHEAHGYAARETLLHVLAERINWFDKYVKNAPPRAN